MRRSRVVRRTRAPRRKLVWARTFGGAILDEEGVNTDNAVVNYPLNDFESTYNSQLIGCTIMATRGIITATMVEPETPGATESYASARFALRIIDVAGIVSGSAQYDYDAIYTNQAHADWFLFEPFALHEGGILGQLETPEARSASEIRRIDNRARRKLSEMEQTIELHIGVPPTGSNHNTAWIHFFWDLSFLIALP